MGAISQQVASRVLLGVAMHGEQLFEGNQDTNAAVSAVSRILYDVPGFDSSLLCSGIFVEAISVP